MNRDDIIFGEITKLIHESALLKARDGFILRPENITAEFAAFVAKYDLYVAFWQDTAYADLPGGTVRIEVRSRALAIRRSIKEHDDLLGNAIVVQDRATAIKLHAACRASDNGAPEPPAV
jgi:hypothetical protein